MHIMDLVPLWLTFALTVAIVILAIYAGILFSRYRKKRAKEGEEADFNTIIGATIGLLAFILAFTFGLSLTRFDARKHLLLDEANSIGTTFLRADFLPEPHRSDMRELLREYVDIRVKLVSHPGEVLEAIEESDRLHEIMWRHAAAIAKMDHKNAPIVALFISSLNEMFDIQTKRVTVGLTYRIPWPMWAALYCLIILSMFGVGALLGTSDKVSWTLVLVLSLAFSAVIMLIADLDRSGAGRRGLINVNPQPMFDLQKQINVAMGGS